MVDHADMVSAWSLILRTRADKVVDYADGHAADIFALLSEMTNTPFFELSDTLPNIYNFCESIRILVVRQAETLA